MAWVIADYHGRIAITLGWAENGTEPQTECEYYVWAAESEAYRDVIGHECMYLPDNAGFYVPRYGGRRLEFQTSIAERVMEVRPTRKPRGRGNWVYRDGEWRRA